MILPWKPRAFAAVLVCFAIHNSEFVDGKVSNISLGFVDFMKEAVWGGSNEGEYGQGRVTPRPSALTYQNQKPPENKLGAIQQDRVKLSAHRTLAEQRMTALEVPPATRTLGADGNPAKLCLVGSCCGWGHRLMRQVHSRPHILPDNVRCSFVYRSIKKEQTYHSSK